MLGKIWAPSLALTVMVFTLPLVGLGCRGAPPPRDVLESAEDVLQGDDPGDAQDPSLDAVTEGAAQAVATVPLASAQPGALAVVRDQAGIRVFALGRSQELLTKTFRAGPGTYR